jgi:hypothetical protein
MTAMSGKGILTEALYSSLAVIRQVHDSCTGRVGCNPVGHPSGTSQWTWRSTFALVFRTSREGQMKSGVLVRAERARCATCSLCMLRGALIARDRSVDKRESAKDLIALSCNVNLSFREEWRREAKRELQC